MTEVIDRQIEDLEKLDDLENYKGKWKNLHFSDEGHSVLSEDMYSSAEEAERIFSEYIVSEKSKGIKLWEFTFSNLIMRTPWNDATGLKYPKYSYYIQIPVGDA